MTDDSQTTPNPTPTSGTAPKQKIDPKTNPLDALEEILKSAQHAKGKGAQQNEPSPEQVSAQQDLEQQQQLAEFEKLNEQNREADKQKLSQQIANLKGVSDMPEYKARVDQQNKKQEQEVEQQKHQDDFQIRQLKHTKI